MSQATHEPAPYFVHPRRSPAWTIFAILLFGAALLWSLLMIIPTLSALQDYSTGAINDSHPGAYLAGRLIVMWAPSLVLVVGGAALLVHSCRMRRKAEVR